VNTKLRRHGGAWELEPSLVRLTSGRQGFSFAGDDQVIRPIVYHSGPAGIERNVPYLVGRDAQRAGTTDVALLAKLARSAIGSAELRVHAPAYLLLHLFAIMASLPPGITTAQVAFAGGLPVEDDANPRVKATLRQRLTGRSEKGSAPIPPRLYASLPPDDPRFAELRAFLSSVKRTGKASPTARILGEWALLGFLLTTGRLSLAGELPPLALPADLPNPNELLQAQRELEAAAAQLGGFDE
jgi:hypothetical protein